MSRKFECFPGERFLDKPEHNISNNVIKGGVRYYWKHQNGAETSCGSSVNALYKVQETNAESISNEIGLLRIFRSIKTFLA